MANENYISQRIKQGMLGAFHDQTLLGFIGVHDSGSIGLLEVFPQYRHQGIGKYLVQAMVVKQVHLDHMASCQLVKSIGFQTSGNTIKW